MTETSLLNACRTLFGQDVNLTRDFLYYLQPSGAKMAYRNQVKVNHPDRFNDSPQHIRQQQTERFREIHDAYHLLKGFLDQKHRRFATLHQPPKHKPASTAGGPTPRQSYKATGTGSNRRSKIPSIPLKFGMYAYYLGKVSYQDLIEALVWQRRQRPMLGVIAARWGWLDKDQVMSILEHRGHSTRFGKKAIELGLLGSLQVDSLVRHQRATQQKIGQYFVEKGLMSAIEADRLAGGLQKHNSQVLAQNRRPQSK